MSPVERASPPRRRPRVVVCGTTFGQVYLEGLRSGDFELAGIVASGSRRSRACAAHYGVPLHCDVASLPADIDAACVVVRGALLGGRGSELAHALMARRIHVLQEQPLHPQEVADSVRHAHHHGVRFAVTSFYRHLLTVRRFIAAANVLREASAPRYVRAHTAVQVGYPLLDILRACFGKIRPAHLAPGDRAGTAGPFRRLEGSFAGVPLLLEVQNQLDPSDPDDHPYSLHRITLGTDAGELTLASPHGPVVWSPRPAIPREVRDGESARLFAEAPSSGDDVGARVIGPSEEPGQGRLLRTLWPGAVRRAVAELLAGEPADVARAAQAQIGLCRLWQDAATGLGPPEHVSPPRRRALAREELEAMSRAARDAEGAA